MEDYDAEAMADLADAERKRRKENPPGSIAPGGHPPHPGHWLSPRVTPPTSEEVIAGLSAQMEGGPVSSLEGEPVASLDEMAHAWIDFSRDELVIIIEALDSHEYWQLSDEQYRSDGYVLDEGVTPEIEAVRAVLDKIERALGREDEEVPS